MPAAVQILSDPEQVAAVAHPVRARILEALREPDTAAGLARGFGRTRQYVHYHLKELERLELVRRTGERRKGNFVEQIYEAAARRFVVSARFAGDPERLAAVFRDQVSLARLADLGERLAADAAGLIDRAAFQGDTIPSASVEAELHLPDEAARAAFMSDLVASLRAVLDKHGQQQGPAFRVALATYPRQEQDDG